MNHEQLNQLRDTYNRHHILLCFNGPFSQGLIEEIGSALKRYLESEAASTSSALDVFTAYVEIAQNIQHYSKSRRYDEMDASGTVIVSRNEEGRYVISAGNIVELADGEALVQRIEGLAAMDKAELKAAYKQQLRAPRPEGDGGAGLGLIDIARKASAPFSCSLLPSTCEARRFFSLRVVI